MLAVQSRMARAALRWSLSDLASASGVGRATVVRFETGQIVRRDGVAAIRRAFEGAGIQFIDRGKYIHGVVPPPGSISTTELRRF